MPGELPPPAADDGLRGGTQGGTTPAPNVGGVPGGTNSLAPTGQVATERPAGQSGSDAVHALARKGIGGILDQFREQYDFIVVDSAPVLPVADSQLIGQHADGVVFSVVRGVGSIPANACSTRFSFSPSDSLNGACVPRSMKIQYRCQVRSVISVAA